MRRALSPLILTAACLVTLRANAQEAGPALPPSISVSAEGNVTVTPDIATIHLSVVTRGLTAQEAAQLNARAQRGVLDTLRALRVPTERITTSGYSLRPDYRYGPNNLRELTGYVATNTVTVELRSIDQVGGVIDAALARGANEVAGLIFSYSGAEQARREAITKAVAKARSDAEAAARGAGVTLGALLNISVGTPMYPSPMNVDRRMMSSMSADAAPPTPIEAGSQAIRVTVSTRWSVRQ